MKKWKKKIWKGRREDVVGGDFLDLMVRRWRMKME
jgi:hypothetical protein